MVKYGKGGSLTAVGSGLLLGKAKALALGIKSSLKHLGHFAHGAKHSIDAVDDIIIATNKINKNKSKHLDLPESLDVNEIHHVFTNVDKRKTKRRKFHRKKSLKRNKK